jgi:hypothetical protein
MNENALNRAALERIAKDIMKLESPELIEGFVAMYLYGMLLD